jgi:hypothetical protein
MPALQRDSSHPKLNRLIDWPAAGRVESMLTRVRNAFFEQRKLCRLFENGAAIVRHPPPRPLPQSRRVIDPCCCKLPSHRPIPCYYAVHGVAALCHSNHARREDLLSLAPTVARNESRCTLHLQRLRGATGKNFSTLQQQSPPLTGIASSKGFRGSPCCCNGTPTPRLQR